MPVSGPRLSGTWQQRTRNQTRGPWSAARRAQAAARVGTWPDRLAAFVAAYRVTAPPRTVDRLATTLGLHRHTLSSLLARHHVTMGQVRALAEASL